MIASAYAIFVLMTQASSKDSDLPAQMCSLVRAFSACTRQEGTCMKVGAKYYPLSSTK